MWRRHRSPCHFDVSAIDIRGKYAFTRRCELDPATPVRGERFSTEAIDARNRQDPGVTGGCELLVQSIVAGGSHNDHVVSYGVSDGVYHCLALSTRSAEAHVDDLGAVVCRPLYSIGDPGVVSLTCIVQHLGVHEAGVIAYPGDPLPVICLGSDDARYMGTVSKVIGGIGSIREVRGCYHFAVQVRVPGNRAGN